MNRYHIFLDELMKEIKYPFVRRKIRNEYTAHLDDAYEAFLAQGMNPKTAESYAMAAMGNPQEIGQMLNNVHHPIFSWLYLACKFFLIVTVLSFLLLFGPSLWQRISTLDGYSASITDELQALEPLYYQQLDQHIVVGNTEFLFQDFVYTENGMVLISVKHQSLNSRSPFLGNLFAYDFETMIDGKPIALTGSNFTIISGIPEGGLDYVFANNPTYTKTWSSHLLLVYRGIEEVPQEVAIHIQTLDGSVRQIQIKRGD